MVKIDFSPLKTTRIEYMLRKIGWQQFGNHSWKVWFVKKHLRRNYWRILSSSAWCESQKICTRFLAPKTYKQLYQKLTQNNPLPCTLPKNIYIYGTHSIHLLYMYQFDINIDSSLKPNNPSLFPMISCISLESDHSISNVVPIPFDNLLKWSQPGKSYKYGLSKSVAT